MLASLAEDMKAAEAANANMTQTTIDLNVSQQTLLISKGMLTSLAELNARNAHVAPTLTKEC